MTNQAVIVYTIWFYIRSVAYLFVIFLAGYLLFNSLDQSHDFVLAFICYPETAYYVSTAILLFFWSYIAWYSASVILEMNPDGYGYINDRLQRRVSLFIGQAPWLILALTFFKAHGYYQGLGTLVLGIFASVFFMWRDKQNNLPGKWPTSVEVYLHNTDKNGYEITPSVKNEIAFIRKYPNVLYYFRVFGLLFMLVLIVLSIPAPLISISRMLRPAAVLLLALSFFTYVWTVAFYFHDFKTRPFLLFLIGWVILVSTWNDNTRIPSPG